MTDGARTQSGRAAGTPQPAAPSATVASSTAPSAASSAVTPSAVALRDDIVEAVRERIVSGELAPGTRLRERNLSEEFGVSRVPVREAILVLEQQRLVHTEPRVGATVTELTARDVAELFDVRLALEPLTARLAAAHRTPEDLVRLEDDHRRSRAAALAGDQREGSRANADFHAHLLEAAHNELLAQLAGPLGSLMQRLFRQTITTHELALCEDHEKLLQAVQQGDAQLAAFWAERHVEGTREQSLSLFS